MSYFNVIWGLSVIFLVSAIRNPKHNMRIDNKYIENDIPQKSDLESYLGSLENLIKFYIENPNEVDVNSVFGFFLMNVNLNSVLKNKANKLPLSLANRFKNLVMKNTRIVAYFRMMTAQSQINLPHYKKLKKISTLFSNESLWISQTKQTDSHQVMESPTLTYKEIQLHFSSWPEYKQDIDSLSSRMMPPYPLTEKCLVIIAENPAYYGNSTLPKCKMPQECPSGVDVGNDIGYGLTNRLLMLIQARFARRCSIFNEEEDRKFVENLCMTSYKEAMFISLNKFDPLMLIIEQITLCSLNGNVEFLRRTWISYILALQTQYGCFSDKIQRKKQALRRILPSRWNLDKGNVVQVGTQCFGPASAGAAAIISAAIKYILELYY